MGSALITVKWKGKVETSDLEWKDSLSQWSLKIKNRHYKLVDPFTNLTNLTVNTNAMVEKTLEKEKLTSKMSSDVQLRYIPKNLKRY